MADLRIVDAPLLSTVKGTEKIPTGGEGNFSVSVNQVADFAKLKWVLATEGYVDNAVGNVQADLNLHKNNESNPHNVTKTQVGLGNVDNTADLDKPLSNAHIAALYLKADKMQVASDLNVKADQAYVDNAVGAISTDASKQYATLALANADINNIALNKNVFISEAVNGGYWYKATAEATSLTKSPYDPLFQGKNYTDQKTKKSVQGVVGKNLFNPNASDVAIGYFPSNTTGVLTANTSYNTTGFISVTAEQQYAISVKHYWAWYDSNKVFISGTSNSDTNKTQTAPQNAVYMRASCPISAWSVFQVEQSSSPTPFESYGVKVDLETIPALTLTEDKLADKTISPAKANFLSTGKNLFSINAATSDKSITNTGDILDNANTKVSNFIPVLPSTTYSASNQLVATFKGVRFVCFYDKNKNVTGLGVSDGTIAQTTFTTSEYTAFVRVTVYKTSADLFQVELGATPTAFERFAYVLKGVNAEQIVVSLDNNQVKESAIDNAAVTPKKTNFLQPSKNLFNKATVVDGILDPSNGVIYAGSSYSVSEQISIKPSTAYYGKGINGCRSVTYYTSSGALIPPGINNSSGTLTFTTPSNAAFVRVTVWKTDLSSFQLEEGSAQTSYEAYGFNLFLVDGTPINTSASLKSGWLGKSWASLGDSITAMATWQGFVTAAHSLVWTNYGIGGTKISGAAGDTNAMCQDTRINAIPTTVDLVSLMGGTNDWAQNVPLGDINSTDPLTFYGALNTFAQKAFTRWPTKRIAVATTPYGEIVDWTGRAGWTSPAHNSLGLTTNDYAEAIRQFCKRVNIHCIDVALSAGWGTYNITEALGGSTTDHLHPASGSNAAKGIGAAYIKGLKDIEPT